MSSDDKPQASPHEPTSGTEGTSQDGANAPTGQFPGAYPVPGYVAPGAPPAGYPPQQPMGPGYYAPTPGYSAPPPGYPAGYPQGNGYPAYPQAHYGWGAPSAPQPGSVPLRPLNIGDLYNGAFAAVKANPGVMIGITAVVVVLSNLVTFLAQVPLTTMTIDTDSDEDASSILTSLAASVGGSIATSIFALLATTVLTGMLTVVVARSVLGDKTDGGTAWRSVTPRLLPLVGLVLLQSLVYLIPAGLMIGLMLAFAGTGSWAAMAAVAIIGAIAIVIVSLALMPPFALATAAVILEGRGPINALRRGFQLQQPGYWRLLGILLLTNVIIGVVGAIVVMPFSLGTLATDPSASVSNVAGTTALGLALSSVGTAIGQILTMPFMAGVQTLLYTDQRMRTERFDLVLQSAAAYQAQTGLPAGPGVWAPPRPV